ncbi:MAG: ParM/StbA family protein [Cyanobacteriota bacterium]|nr:ParM/StbA family protein [Cyanobacteriota bacterium]
MSTKTPTQNPSAQLLSIDLGRTSTKACISRQPEDVVLIPANVAHLSVEEVRRGGFAFRPSDPLLDIWLEYQGKGYAIGQLAADFGANLGVGQSKVADALIKVFACIGNFDLKQDLLVVLGIPYLSQEQFDKEKEEITSLLQGPHVMAFRGQDRAVAIQQVWVMPEGYGSLIWCEGQKKDYFSNLSVAVIDIGHQTTDFLMVDRFRFARGISMSESFGMNEFYVQVAEKIPGADSQSLSLIEGVNRPQGKRFYRPRGATKPTPLDDILPELRKKFARELSQRLLAWLPERATDVIVTGGGGEFFWDDLRPLLEEAALTPHLAEHSRTANALGQYIYGEVQLSSVGNTP